MGNTLVAYAPSLIRPVEYYLTDIPELNFDAKYVLKICNFSLQKCVPFRLY